jgi:hypothetical protein
MNISKQDAGDALDVIRTSEQRMREHKGYREASPFFIVWGLVWIVANAVTDLAPRFAGRVWLWGVIAGTVATLLLVVQQSRRRSAQNVYTASERAAIGRKAALLGITLWSFFPAMLFVLWPLSAQQNNAFISLTWAFVYMAAGAWLGMRLFVTGAVTALAVLAGFFLVKDHYFMWMAVFGGGSLLLGGFWLRKL